MRLPKALCASLLLPLLPLAAQTMVINCGSASDAQFTGGGCGGFPTNPAWTCAYTSPTLPAAYPSLRFGPTIHYQIAVAPGVYAVALVFVEPTKTAAGQRTQTISIQGGQGGTGLISGPVMDVFQLAGGMGLPYTANYTTAVAVAAGIGVGVLDVQVSSVVGASAVLSQITITSQAPKGSVTPQFLTTATPPTPGTCPANGVMELDAAGYLYVCDGLAATPTTSPVWWRSPAPYLSTWTAGPKVEVTAWQTCTGLKAAGHDCTNLQAVTLQLKSGGTVQITGVSGNGPGPGAAGWTTNPLN